jgi:hypothetical protein
VNIFSEEGRQVIAQQVVNRIVIYEIAGIVQDRLPPIDFDALDHMGTVTP